MSSLAALPNIGKVLEQNLLIIGITTPDELRELGAKAAFLQIRGEVDSGACLHMLYGLQGAVENIRGSKLSEATKQNLQTFFRSL